jgi:predicted Zn-dependent protease
MKFATFTPSQDQEWEIIVIAKDDPNAMVMPGGKIVVHTGLLELLSSDDQVAAVLGHEAAHVLARHAVSHPAFCTVFYSMRSFFHGRCSHEPVLKVY